MKKRVLLFFGVVACLVFAALLYSLIHTTKAFTALKQQNITAVTTHAQKAKWFPTILSTVTFHLQPDLEAWRSSLLLLTELPDTLSITQQYAQTALAHSETSTDNAAQFKSRLTSLSAQLKHLENSFNHSWFLRRTMRNQEIETQLTTAQQLVASILRTQTGPQTYLLLFQNTHELRATGGFIGTYAMLSLNEGVIERFDIQDIYVPDGQFTGYVEAPAGVKEYLSSGKGLRLPDANWHADFPTSAKQLLSFFSLSGEQNIDGVIAVNLPVAEKLLGVTGPIFLQDYQTMVDQYNFAQIARQDRDQFFPGSQQKKHFMSSFFNQLLVALEKLEDSKRPQLISLIADSANIKDLQFFSQDKPTQGLFEKLKLAGSIEIASETDFYVYPVESNVGINKANKNIDRDMSINLGDNSSTITMIFTNHNTPPSVEYLANLAPTEAKHLTYINYQRFLLLPGYQVAEIRVNEQKLTTWDEEIIGTNNQDKLKQVGFLVTVPEQKQAIIQVTLTHPTLSAHPNIQVDSQPGIQPISFQLR